MRFIFSILSRDRIFLIFLCFFFLPSFFLISSNPILETKDTIFETNNFSDTFFYESTHLYGRVIVSTGILFFGLFISFLIYFHKINLRNKTILFLIISFVCSAIFISLKTGWELKSRSAKWQKLSYLTESMPNVIYSKNKGGFMGVYLLYIARFTLEGNPPPEFTKMLIPKIEKDGFKREDIVQCYKQSKLFEIKADDIDFDSSLKDMTDCTFKFKKSQFFEDEMLIIRTDRKDNKTFISVQLGYQS